MERRKRRAARPAVGQVLTIGTALSVGLAFALGATGCGGGSGQKQAEAQKSTATAGERWIRGMSPRIGASGPRS